MVTMRNIWNWTSLPIFTVSSFYFNFFSSQFWSFYSLYPSTQTHTHTHTHTHKYVAKHSRHFECCLWWFQCHKNVFLTSYTLFIILLLFFLFCSAKLFANYWRRCKYIYIYIYIYIHIFNSCFSSLLVVTPLLVFVHLW